MNENSTEDPRAGLMHALSVAEQIVATAPIGALDSISIDANGEVSLLLYNRPEAVAEAASTFEFALSLRTDHGGAGRPYVQAVGAVLGVKVRLWSLGPVDEQERYAACVPVSGEPAPGVASLPAAWSAAVAS